MSKFGKGKLVLPPLHPLRLNNPNNDDPSPGDKNTSKAMSRTEELNSYLYHSERVGSGGLWRCRPS
ncbi:hypothetical protein Hamer_G015433 [Homarus americanus]|uniref:Uncharacterized protein n=1 Tax=Homarus americanus TaxID=6706 RepID=A0A8J5TK54_HOMAM|nr:hypothetical protein Hamer_G015433 [Homarus americanus]